ncbi:MAG: serine/threonine protein kinase, partial [Ruminococcus sp.]|nr:serine/threonine protein kinase [Ruminococcus sp.]
MSEIIHKSSRGTVEVFEENGEKRIRRTVNAELPLYETLKNSECKYLPKIYSVDIAEGKTVVTEEFISDKNLLAANLNEKQVIRAMVQLCAALDFIHGLGIIHRDIKPSNILLSENGNIRLIDFEAARFVRDDKDRDTRYLGTDGFAPPEQYGFSQTDFRTDIYAAGQTMKTLLGSLSAKKKYAKIIRKCTALDPAERYQSAKALADALTNRREKISVSAVLAAAAAVLIFTAFVPKKVPAENISDEIGIVAEAETSSAETTAVSETTLITETTTASETSIAAETAAEAESVSETSNITETEFSATTAVTDENGFAHFTLTAAVPEYPSGSQYYIIDLNFSNGDGAEHNGYAETECIYVFDHDIAMIDEIESEDVYTFKAYRLDFNSDVSTDNIENGEQLIRSIGTLIANGELTATVVEVKDEQIITGYEYDEYTKENVPKYDTVYSNTEVYNQKLQIENGYVKVDLSGIDYKKPGLYESYSYIISATAASGASSSRLY